VEEGGGIFKKKIWMLRKEKRWILEKGMSLAFRALKGIKSSMTSYTP
jgi:hypothetical protein